MTDSPAVVEHEGGGSLVGGWREILKPMGEERIGSIHIFPDGESWRVEIVEAKLGLVSTSVLLPGLREAGECAGWICGNAIPARPLG